MNNGETLFQPKAEFHSHLRRRDSVSEFQMKPSIIGRVRLSFGSRYTITTETTSSIQRKEFKVSNILCPGCCAHSGRNYLLEIIIFKCSISCDVTLYGLNTAAMGVLNNNVTCDVTLYGLTTAAMGVLFNNVTCYVTLYGLSTAATGVLINNVTCDVTLYGLSTAAMGVLINNVTCDVTLYGLSTAAMGGINNNEINPYLSNVVFLTAIIVTHHAHV